MFGGKNVSEPTPTHAGVKWRHFVVRYPPPPPALFLCGSIKQGSRDFIKELNYQEAYKESYLAYAAAALPGEVQTLLLSPEVQ